MERRKNELLKATRNLSFEQVENEIHNNRILYNDDNPTRKNQKIVVVEINNYPCVVPYVIDNNGDWFLKTIYPSRKMKKELEK